MAGQLEDKLFDAVRWGTVDDVRSLFNQVVGPDT
jgi:hypothetical protein